MSLSPNTSFYSPIHARPTYLTDSRHQAHLQYQTPPCHSFKPSSPLLHSFRPFPWLWLLPKFHNMEKALGSLATSTTSTLNPPATGSHQRYATAIHPSTPKRSGSTRKPISSNTNTTTTTPTPHLLSITCAYLGRTRKEINATDLTLVGTITIGSCRSATYARIFRGQRRKRYGKRIRSGVPGEGSERSPSPSTWLVACKTAILGHTLLMRQIRLLTPNLTEYALVWTRIFTAWTRWS